MRQLEGKIEGPFSVEEDSALHGMIAGGAIVRKGTMFHVNGMIIGNLTVEADAEAIVHGTVNGTIWNHGNVTVYGTIDDIVNAAPNCHTVIDSAALIRKRKL